MSSRIFEKTTEKINNKTLRSWIQHCTICGASFPPINILCLHCWKKLKKLYLPPRYMVRLQSSFLHVRLIDWSLENNKFVQFLIQNLKGTQGSPLFELLAQEFCFRIRQISSIKKFSPYILIPCPATPEPLTWWNFLIQKENPKIHVKKDHSFYWAQSLSQETKYPIQNILSHIPNVSLQKEKNLHDRYQRRFFVQEPFEPRGNYVFTDDIVTSGATVKAAYRAVQKPPTFMVWSIFWKKKELE